MDIILSDSEWEILKPLLPQARGFGHPRTVDLREIFNGIFYVQSKKSEVNEFPSRYLSKIDTILTVKRSLLRKMPRLAFDVDDQFSQEFNELVQLTGASSKADAFRKAISLYKVVTKEELEAINSTSKTHEMSSEAANLITTDSDALVDEMENIIASVEKGYGYSLNNLDSNKTEEIFGQIDLAQARIAKDQEEIQSLAKETDELLNQLEYKAI